jgi:hypothetical protein
MAATEILQRHAVHHRAGRGTEASLDDFLRVGSGHRVHGVEAELETAGDQFADRLEVEQRLHQVGVVRHRVDHLHLHTADGLAPDVVERDRGSIDDAVAAQFAAAGEDGIGDSFRCRAAVAGVVLDAEVAFRPARIVAGGKDQAAVSTVLADHAGGRRRGQDAALPHQHLAETVGCRHAQDDLDRLTVVVAPVATQHQRAARWRDDGIEHGLDEVLQVVRRLEHGNLLAQA